VRAVYAPCQEDLLRAAQDHVTALRYLPQLSSDLVLPGRRHPRFATERLDEAGRTAGGWLRSERHRWQRASDLWDQPHRPRRATPPAANAVAGRCPLPAGLEPP
jgi:hypothetical protein